MMKKTFSLFYLVLLLETLEGVDDVSGLGRVRVKFVHLMVRCKDCMSSAFKLDEMQSKE